MKVELLDPVMVKGLPRAEDFAALDALADTIAAKHAGLAATVNPARAASLEAIPRVARSPAGAGPCEFAAVPRVHR